MSSSFCLSKHFHPSKLEANDCNWLHARQQNGEIRNLKLYPSYPLHVSGKLWKRWKPDFYFEEKIRADETMNWRITSWQSCIFESKGYNRSDAAFRLKLAAFLTEYQGIKVFINRKPASLSPSLRIMAEGIKHSNKRRLIRTWDRLNHRWTTIPLNTPKFKRKGT